MTPLGAFGGTDGLPGAPQRAAGDPPEAAAPGEEQEDVLPSWAARTQRSGSAPRPLEEPEGGRRPWAAAADAGRIAEGLLVTAAPTTAACNGGGEGDGGGGGSQAHAAAGEGDGWAGPRPSGTSASLGEASGGRPKRAARESKSCSGRPLYGVRREARG